MRRRGRLLIVDDDPDICWMMAEVLGEGYEVLAAPNPAEALARAREAPPDAIVVDLALGGASGWALIRLLQADPGLRTVPMIVLSAHHVAHPPPGLAPCAGYLTKPCSLLALRELLSRLIVP